MGLPIDSRVVEYAYLADERRKYNAPVDDGGQSKFRHIICLVYELRDTNKNFYETKTVIHETDPMNDRQTITDAINAINGVIVQWVINDKAQLSGYQI